VHISHLGISATFQTDFEAGAISFIKIDVEDMETSVVLGGRETIA